MVRSHAFRPDRATRSTKEPYKGLRIATAWLVAREVEHRFLVRDDRWRSQAGAGTHYQQGYLSVQPERNIRVRVGGGEAKITLKSNWQGAAREEYEYSIPEADGGQILSRLCLKPLVEKTRYEVWSAGLKWEIDEFDGENRGLIVAEVETEKPPQEISKPDWIGKEVTGDPRYFNVNLVTHPYSHWPQPVGN
jgi:adenylate cyclase